MKKIIAMLMLVGVSLFSVAAFADDSTVAASPLSCMLAVNC